MLPQEAGQLHAVVPVQLDVQQQELVGVRVPASRSISGGGCGTRRCHSPGPGYGLFPPAHGRRLFYFVLRCAGHLRKRRCWYMSSPLGMWIFTVIIPCLFPHDQLCGAPFSYLREFRLFFVSCSANSDPWVEENAPALYRSHAVLVKGMGFFDHSFSHSAVWNTWKQRLQRVTESK